MANEPLTVEQSLTARYADARDQILESEFELAESLPDARAFCDAAARTIAQEQMAKYGTLQLAPREIAKMASQRFRERFFEKPSEEAKQATPAKTESSGTDFQPETNEQYAARLRAKQQQLRSCRPR